MSTVPIVPAQQWQPPVSKTPTAEETAIHLRQIYTALNQHDQAIIQVDNKIPVATTTTTTSSTSGGTTVVSTGVTSFNSSSGTITFFPNLATVNDQTGQTTYQTMAGDNGALILLNDASPIAVSINNAVVRPWFTTILNEGTGLATLTPIGGTINGGAAISLATGKYATIYFDGTNFFAPVLPVVPQNTPGVTHEWIASYNSTTGVFTLSQPAFTDISGIATTAQIGTGTPSAGQYVDGGTGAWTALPGGLTVIITTAALTVGGTQGSQTFTAGRLTAQVQAT